MPAPPFTEEHEAVREAVAHWARDRLAASARAWDEVGHTPRAAIGEAAGQGWLSVAGTGPADTDPLSLVAVAEGLAVVGAGPALAILAATVDGLPLLAAAGHAWRDAAMAGQHVIALVDRAELGEPVVNGVVADAFVLVGATADQGVVLVCRDQLEPEPAPVPTLGVRAAGLADVAVGDAGEPLSLTPDVLAAHRNQRLVARAALCTACAQRAWDAARTYALEREAFGRPIGRFQVNRHALARTATLLVAARQLVLHAAVTLVTDDAAAAPAVDEAYLFAARTAVTVTDVALQLHGGYGYSTEFEVERAWRDARFWQATQEPLRRYAQQGRRS